MNTPFRYVHHYLITSNKYMGLSYFCVNILVSDQYFFAHAFVLSNHISVALK